MKIEGFFGEFRFLSNFWPSEITVAGQEFPTVEHAYQALKSDEPRVWPIIASLPTPKAAKYAGREWIAVRPRWDNIRVDVMRMLLRKKFAIPALREGLLLTHPFHLEETNTWGDTFWGVSNGRGQNELGKLLMLIREEIRQNR